MEQTIYYITLDLFLKENKKDIKEMDNNNDLFPDNWYSIDDYRLKTDILGEAMKKKIPIIETVQYQDFITKKKSIN